MMKDAKLINRAKKVFPGGVNSPVRAFGELDCPPPVLVIGKGPYVYDINQRQMIDLVLGYGPHLCGHSHPDVVESMQEAAANGPALGLTTEREIEFGEYLVSCLPGIDKIRLVNSGTEATMSALRLVRAFTGKEKIIKFAGCYHGHGDSFLISAGSGAMQHGVPSSPGVISDIARNTIICDYNALDEVEKAFETHAGNIAGVFLEPVVGNMNLVLPQSDFLSNLKSLCEKNDALFIADEVMTGFRCPGDKVLASNYFGVEPDIVCLGKVIGGGAPVGAYGAKNSIMKHISPEGGVYQAGTLSGNGLACSSGLTNLKLAMSGLKKKAEENCSYFVESLKELASSNHYRWQISQFGSMMGFLIADEAPKNLTDVSNADLKLGRVMLSELIRLDVHVPPSPYEAMFFSSEHRKAVCDQLIEKFEKAYKAALSKEK